MGIIFDLDGTLINTLFDLGNSCNRTLEKFGHPTHSIDKYQYFVGNGMRKLLERSLPGSYNDDFETMFAFFLNDYEKHHTNDSKLYPGVYESLKKLNELKIPIAVCTNKKQEFTDTILKHYLADIDFIAAIGDRFDGHHKPDPRHALEIARHMDMDPESIYFVGDSNVDMMTAQNAGMIPVGVSWGFREVKELQEHGAKMIINTMEEIVVEVKSKKC